MTTIANLVSGAIKIVLVFSLIVGLIALLPSAEDHPVPQAVLDSITNFYTYINIMNYILPMSSFIICFVISLFFWAYSYLFRLVVWLGGLIVRVVSV